MSTTLILHNLDETLARQLSQEATRRQMSVEQLVIVLLRDTLKLPVSSQAVVPPDDLDDLAGTWTEAEAAQFNEATAHFSTIDEAQWR